MNRKVMCVVIFMCLTLASVSGDVFFLFSSEKCNDLTVPVDSSAKEGIMEGMFESGHIIFDDVSGKETSKDELIRMAWKYGAKYLIAVYVDSIETERENKPAKLSVKANYYLYDAKTNELVGDGELNLEEDNQEEAVNKAKVWFDLGISISGAIEGIYNEKQK